MLELFPLPDFDAGFLLVFAPKKPDIHIIHFDKGFLYEKRGVICFHIEMKDEGDSFQAVVVKPDFSDKRIAVIIWAIRARRSVSGKRLVFSFYCQVVSEERYLFSTIPELVEEIRATSLEINQDVDFAADGLVAVALGNTAPYLTAENEGPVVKVAQVVYNDGDKIDMLRENADFSESLLRARGSGISRK